MSKLFSTKRKQVLAALLVVVAFILPFSLSAKHPNTAVASNTGPYCTGEAIALVANGGVSYAWSGPAGFSSNLQFPQRAGATPSMSGTYTVTVTDAFGATSAATTQVTVFGSPFINANNTGPYCEGQQIRLSVSGALSYSWVGPDGFVSNIQNPTINGATLAMAGVYGVTITDGNGCTASSSTAVQVNPTPQTSLSSNSPICVGTQLQLSATGTNGTTYVWSTPNGQQLIGPTPSISNATNPPFQGTYVVTVTDANGCTTTGQTVVIVNPVPAANATTNITVCAGTPAYLSAFGGATYLWSNGMTGNDVTIVQNNPGPYAYNVTVTDNNGCTAMASSLVNFRPLPIANAGPDVTLSSLQTYTPPTPTATGGTLPYNYVWTTTPTVNGNGATVANPVTGPFSATSTLLCLEVTDAYGCSAFDCATVNTSPCALQLNAQVNSLSPCPGSLHTISTSVTGATGDLLYNWTYNGPATISGFNGSVANPGSYVLQQAGIYTFSVTVTDLNSQCVSSAQTSVTVSPNPSVLIANQVNYCVGSTVNLNATASGTVGPYSYQWVGPMGTAVGPNWNFVSSIPFSTGTYTVTVEDGNGCTAVNNTSVLVTALPAVVANNTGPYCAGEYIALNVSPSGNAPFSYQWQGVGGFSATQQFPIRPLSDTTMAGLYQITVTDVNGCSASGSTSVVVGLNPVAGVSVSQASYCVGSIIQLNANGGLNYQWTSPQSLIFNANPVLVPNANISDHNGIWRVTVTDVNGCTATNGIQVNVTANPSLSINNSVPVFCQGNTSTLTAISNSPISLTYTWSNGLPGTISQTVSPLTSTAYNLTITDALGCTASASTNVTVNPLPTAHAGPDVFIPTTATYSPPIGVGTGGTAPYTYLWTTSPTNQLGDSSIVETPVFGPMSAAQTQICVTVTDVAGCTATDCANVDTVTCPLGIVANISVDTICSGQTFALSSTVSGNAGALSYQWASLPLVPSFVSNVANPGLFLVNTPGSYTFNVTVTDAGNNCSDVSSIDLVVNARPILSLVNGDNPYCEQEMISLSVNSAGTVGPYTYSWTGPNGFNSGLQSPTIPNCTIINEGQYSVLVADGNGCTSQGNIGVNVNTNPVATAANDAPVCIGGSFNLVASGGFTYQWTSPEGFTINGATPVRSNANPAMGGLYTVQVTNLNGCTSTATTTVTVRPSPVITASPGGPYCAGQSINLFATGALSYQWISPTGALLNGDAPVIANANPAIHNGTFCVTATDNVGCTTSNCVSVQVNPLPIAVASNAGDYCPGNTIDIFAAGGNSYLWSGPQGYTSSLQNNSISNGSTINGGLYTVTVTDVNGCSSIASTTVLVNGTPLFTNVGSTSPYCVGQPIALSSTLVGGIQYVWSGPNNYIATAQHPVRPNATLADSGTYNVTATDLNYCTATASTVVSVNVAGTLVAQGDTVCTGATIGLNATIANGNTYVWQAPSGALYNNQNQSVTLADSTAHTGIWSVTASDTNGCTATSTAQVVVLPLPSVSVSGLAFACSGDTVQLNVSGGLAYQWFTNDTTTSILVPVQTGNLQSNQNWSVSASDSNGCIATATGYIVVNPTPNPIINGGVDTICNAAAGVLLQTQSAGTSFTWSPTNQPGAAIVSIPSMDPITYSVTATSAFGCTGTDSITVLGLGILGCPQFPLAIRDINHTLINKVVRGNVLNNDNYALIAELLEAPAAGSLQVWSPTTGNYSYIPATGFTGLDSFSYRICTNGLCDTTIAYVHVWPYYADYTATFPDVFYASPGQNTIGQVLGAELGTTQVTALNTSGSWGVLNIDASGNVSWQCAALAPAPSSYQFWVETCDGQGNCFDNALWLHVLPASSSVKAADDAAICPAHGLALGDASDNDDAAAATYTALDVPVGGQLTFQANGTFQFRAAWGFCGPSQFRYSTCVGSICDTATVYLLVRPILPLALNDNHVTLPGVSIQGNVLLNDNDPQGLLLSILPAQLNTAANGLLNLQANGSYTYTPALNFSGLDSVRYTICNNIGACDSAWIYITVRHPRNINPVLIPDEARVPNTISSIGTLANNDVGRGLVYSLLTPPNNGVCTILANGSYTYTPANAYVGTDAASYIACDVDAVCDTAWIIWHVLPDVAFGEPLTPLASPDVFVTTGPLNADVSLNDLSRSGIMNFELIQANALGNLQLNANGAFSYIPLVGETGPSNFIYRACDAGLCDTAMVALLVLPQYPFADPDLNAGLENTVLSGNLAQNDFAPQTTALNYQVVQAPACGTFVLSSNGFYTFDNTGCSAGSTAYALVSACDAWGLCDTSWLEVNTSAANAVPQANDDAYRLLAQGTLNANVLVNDLDPMGQGLTVTLLQGNALLNPQGNLSYVAAIGFVGMDTLIYAACDASNQCDTAQVIIEIVLPWQNLAPLAGEGLMSTIQANAVSLANPQALATSPNESPVTLSVLTLPQGGVLSNWTFTPDPCFIGTTAFTYLACDSTQLCDTGTVHILVYPAEAAVNQYFTDSMIWGDAKQLCFPLDTDLPASTASVQAISRNGLFSVQVTDFTPCLNIQAIGVGFDTIDIVVLDSCGNRDSILLYSTVFPLTEDTLIQIPAGTTQTVCFSTFSDELPGSPSLTWNIINPGNSCLTVLSIDSLGCIEFEAALNPCTGMAVLLACDGNWCDTTFIYLETIGDVGMPNAVNDTLVVPFGESPGSIASLLNDSFGNSVAVLVGEPVITQYPAYGTAFWDNVDSVFVYNAPERFCGIDSFRYQITNQSGNSDQATVVVFMLCREVKIYDGISPNNDGANDYLVIEGLERFPDHLVEVYNRWGSLVFTTTSYDNTNSAARFEGHWDGVLLPDGTYVVYLSYQDWSGVKRVISQTIEVFR